MNQLDTEAQLRNFKDFLTQYNQMTDTCFSKCIDELNSRILNKDEENCVNSCTSKFIAANHRMMSIYVDVQSVLISKRIEEATAAEVLQETTVQQK